MESLMPGGRSAGESLMPGVQGSHSYQQGSHTYQEENSWQPRRCHLQIWQLQRASSRPRATETNECQNGYTTYSTRIQDTQYEDIQYKDIQYDEC